MLRKSIKERFDLSCMWSKNMILIEFRLSVIKLEQNSNYVYYLYKYRGGCKTVANWKNSYIPNCFIFFDKVKKHSFKLSGICWSSFLVNSTRYLLPILENKSIKTNLGSNKKFCKIFAESSITWEQATNLNFEHVPFKVWSSAAK